MSVSILPRASAWILCLLLPAAAWALPPVQTWTLANGVRVYFMASHSVPIVDVDLVFDAGSARDPRGQEGLAMLTNSLLGQGATHLDTDAIARREDDLGLALGQGSGRDTAGIGAEMLAEPKVRDRAARLMASLLTHPTFPVASFQRKQKQALLGLKLTQQSLQATAGRAFYPLLYPDQPYGQHPSGTKRSLTALRLQDLRRFYARYYVGRNAVLALVGDMSTAAAHRFAETLAGGLPAGEAPLPLPAVAMPTQASQHQRYFNSVQTQILLGAPGIARGDPDSYALAVGNYILGGDPLESRLGQAIRQKRGLSYTTYSAFSLMRRPGPFIVSVLTRNDERSQALAVARRTLAAYVQTGPTDQEVAAAKRYITGSFPLGIDSDSKLVSDLSVIGFYRLPPDYLDRYIASIEAVTTADVRAALHRHLHPDRMVTLVVGGAE